MYTYELFDKAHYKRAAIFRQYESILYFSCHSTHTKIYSNYFITDDMFIKYINFILINLIYTFRNKTFPKSFNKIYIDHSIFSKVSKNCSICHFIISNFEL